MCCVEGYEEVEECGYTSDSDDEGFYPEEDNRVEEIKGITGKVSSFTFTGVSFPCFIFRDDVQIPKHKLLIVSNMVKTGNMGEKDTSIYFQKDGSLFKIGALSGTQIMGFLDLMGTDCLKGYVSEEKELVGGSLYSLCTVF